MVPLLWLVRQNPQPLTTRTGGPAGGCQARVSFGDRPDSQDGVDEGLGAMADALFVPAGGAEVTDVPVEQEHVVLFQRGPFSVLAGPRPV